MKKIILLVLIFIITQKLNAQQNSCDFEGSKVLSFGFWNGTLDSLIKNPALNTINKSAHCAKYIRDTAFYDNIKFFPYKLLTDVSSYAKKSNPNLKITLKLYSTAPVGTIIQLQLGIRNNNTYPAGIHSEYIATTTVQNAWELITFNYFQSPIGSVAQATVIDKIVLLFNPNSHTKDIYYFDDLTYSVSTTDIALPLVKAPQAKPSKKSVKENDRLKSQAGLKTFEEVLFAKVLYGARKNIPLAHSMVYVTSTKGDTLNTTKTDEYGDFEFRKSKEKSVNIVVANNDKIKIEQEIYLANQNGIIVSKLSKTKAGFTYRLLSADIIKLAPLLEADTDMKIEIFTKSTDKTFSVSENIYYLNNEYKLTTTAMQKLDVIYSILKKDSKLKMEIYSHTDSRGDDAENFALSNMRSNEVLEYFVSKGLERARLIAKGMGETKILNRCDNTELCSEKEHALNRRTEFKFIKT